MDWGIIGYLKPVWFGMPIAARTSGRVVTRTDKLHNGFSKRYMMICVFIGNLLNIKNSVSKIRNLELVSKVAHCIPEDKECQHHSLRNGK